MIRERLVTLMADLDEMRRKAKLRKAELDDEYNLTLSVAQSNSLHQQTFVNLGNFIKRLYLFKQFRRTSTPRELTVLAQQRARQRYEWYQASFNIVIYSDIVKTILEPLIAHVDKQKATCEGGERELEGWYEENRELCSANLLQSTIDQIDQVHPRIIGKGQLEKVISSDHFNIEQKLEQIYKIAFEERSKAGGYVMLALKPALQYVTSETLEQAVGEEHLIQCLCRPDMENKRNAFFERSQCMLSFARDVPQNILSHLEQIELVGYGVDGHQGMTAPDLLPALDELLKNQSTRPDTISTDISDELVLLKTSHGLPISAIRPIHELQRAYQVMNTVRRAPYLHIDYADEVRAGYVPLVNVAWTYQELIKIWHDEADSLNYRNPKQANEMRTALTKYESVLQSKGIYTGGTIDVIDENDPFFDLVDELRWAIRATLFLILNPDPVVAQALMRFADLEDILHAQGWIKIESTYGERFNPNLHNVREKRSAPDMPSDRVIEVVRHGYINHHRMQFRPAIIDVSL